MKQMQTEIAQTPPPFSFSFFLLCKLLFYSPKPNRDSDIYFSFTFPYNQSIMVRYLFGVMTGGNALVNLLNKRNKQSYRISML